MKPAIVSTASREATSPAWWPPIPSHTTSKPSATRMESSFLARRLPTWVRLQVWIIPGCPLVVEWSRQHVASHGRAVSGSVRQNRNAWDLWNPERSSGRERCIQGQAIRLGDDLGPEAIAIVQFGERGERVSRPDGVNNERHFSHLVLEGLERRPVRRIERESGKEPLPGLAKQPTPHQVATLVEQIGHL